MRARLPLQVVGLGVDLLARLPLRVVAGLGLRLLLQRRCRQKRRNRWLEPSASGSRPQEYPSSQSPRPPRTAPPPRRPLCRPLRPRSLARRTRCASTRCARSSSDWRRVPRWWPSRSPTKTTTTTTTRARALPPLPRPLRPSPRPPPRRPRRIPSPSLPLARQLAQLRRSRPVAQEPRLARGSGMILWRLAGSSAGWGRSIRMLKVPLGGAAAGFPDRLGRKAPGPGCPMHFWERAGGVSHSDRSMWRPPACAKVAHSAPRHVQVKLLMPKGGGGEDSTARLVMRVENVGWHVKRGPSWARRASLAIQRPTQRRVTPRGMAELGFFPWGLGRRRCARANVGISPLSTIRWGASFSMRLSWPRRR